MLEDTIIVLCAVQGCVLSPGYPKPSLYGVRPCSIDLAKSARLLQIGGLLTPSRSVGWLWSWTEMVQTERHV
jgi:hypothetical protein